MSSRTAPTKTSTPRWLGDILLIDAFTHLRIYRGSLSTLSFLLPRENAPRALVYASYTFFFSLCTSIDSTRLANVTGCTYTSSFLSYRPSPIAHRIDNVYTRHTFIAIYRSRVARGSPLTFTLCKEILWRLTGYRRYTRTRSVCPSLGYLRIHHVCTSTVIRVINIIEMFLSLAICESQNRYFITFARDPSLFVSRVHEVYV